MQYGLNVDLQLNCRALAKIIINWQGLQLHTQYQFQLGHIQEIGIIFCPIPISLLWSVQLLCINLNTPIVNSGICCQKNDPLTIKSYVGLQLLANLLAITRSRLPWATDWVSGYTLGVFVVFQKEGHAYVMLPFFRNCLGT